jgi:ketosteroid isomerase-like protein
MKSFHYSIIKKIKMKKTPLALTSGLLIFIFLVIGCCKKKDLSSEVESIKATDRHYSQISAEKGMNTAFLAMQDSSGVIIRRNHMPFEGIKEIRDLLMKDEDTSFILTWEPLKAFVAASGDLGYSYGTYLVTSRQNSQKIGDGTYVTIWRKSGKEWKAVLDTGSSGLEEPAANK